MIRNRTGWVFMLAILLLRLRSKNITREVAKICEEGAPWDKSDHFRIHAVLYSNKFRIIDDISSVLSLSVCLFFSPEYGLLPKQLNILDAYA